MAVWIPSSQKGIIMEQVCMEVRAHTYCSEGLWFGPTLSPVSGFHQTVNGAQS